MPSCSQGVLRPQVSDAALYPLLLSFISSASSAIGFLLVLSFSKLGKTDVNF